jgi:HEAT repeat protein
MVHAGYLSSLPSDPGQGADSVGNYDLLPEEGIVSCRVHGPVTEDPEVRTAAGWITLRGAVSASNLELEPSARSVSISELSDRAGSSSALVRRTVAVALRSTRVSRAFELLGPLTEDPDHQVRKHAVWSLGVIARGLQLHTSGSRFDRPELATEVGLIRARRRDDAQNVRDFAAFALARLGDPEAVQTVIDLLDDPARPPVRREQGVDALLDLAGDALRRQVAGSLETMASGIQDQVLAARVAEAVGALSPQD